MALRLFGFCAGAFLLVFFLVVFLAFGCRHAGAALRAATTRFKNCIDSNITTTNGYPQPSVKADVRGEAFAPGALGQRSAEGLHVAVAQGELDKSLNLEAAQEDRKHEHVDSRPRAQHL